MAIPTSRTKEKAEILLHTERCTGCGLCVMVCKDFNFVLENKKVKISETPVFGCIGCGHCMAVCPSSAIEIHGRTLIPGHLFELRAHEKVTDYHSLLALLQRRRSMREFQDKEVDPEMIEKILTAAVTAPMGLPPSDVNVLVIKGKEKNKAFVNDFCDYLDGMKWFVSGWFLALIRPFLGKENHEMLKNFVRPLFGIYINSMKKGINVVTYDAPLSMYFYGSPYTDPADPIVAATYAMIAGESLGLGTCMLGAIHPMIQYGKKASQFRQRHGIKFKSREGVFVIFGHPALKYQKGISRTFASVTYGE